MNHIGCLLPAEYRILLRQDNADERLTKRGYDLGLASKERLDLVNQKLNGRNQLLKFVKERSIKPEEINPILEKLGTSPTNQSVKLIDIISRPQVNIVDLAKELPFLDEYFNSIQERKDEIIDSAEIVIKYSGYIERERLLADKFKRLDEIVIENKFDYEKLNTISTEARHKLKIINPHTIGQASRIPGVSPADINVLLILLGR